MEGYVAGGGVGVSGVEGGCRRRCKEGYVEEEVKGRVCSWRR